MTDKPVIQAPRALRITDTEIHVDVQPRTLNLAL